VDGVARVHVNRWGDGSAHLHLWFLARPYGRLQLRGTFLSLWDDILPPIDEAVWRANLGHVGAWLAEFGGRSMVAPPTIEWQTPSGLGDGLTGPAAAPAASFFSAARLGDEDGSNATPLVPEPAAGSPELSPDAGSAQTSDAGEAAESD
jgi:hypothetical protein